MKKNALNIFKNSLTMTIVELDTKFIMRILQFFIIMTMTNYLTLTKTLIYLDSF